MHFHIITLFPKAFSSYLGESILKRAIEGTKPRRSKGSGPRSKASGKIKVSFYNPRDFTKDKWRRIDRRPFSGGPGMVIEALPVIKAIEKALSQAKDKKAKIIFLSPGGKEFNTKKAKNLSIFKNLVIICGRYEGIDERVRKVFKTESLSVGPYVLTGGELPAMILIDSISRQVKGVLGNFSSREESRISSSAVYTRPESFSYKNKKYSVPKVLLSGNHKKIEEWKLKKKK